MSVRFPWLVLLGVVFLASVCVSLKEKKLSYQECLESCKSEIDPYRLQSCKLSCKLVHEHEEEQQQQQHEEEGREREHPEPHEERGSRERGRQEGEKAEDQEHREREDPRPQDHEGEQWTGKHRREDPEERERLRQRVEETREREREEEELRRREKEEQQDWEDSHSHSHSQNKNPFHFSSKRFQTLFKNQHGHIRLLQSFDQRSPQLQNLRDYRLVELITKPNTLLLPHHADADFLLIVLSGRALINFVKPYDRDPYYLDRGYAQTIPAGTTFYILNPDKNKDLRVIKLAIPVNNPGKFENFFLSSTQDQQSYLQGFSKNILEASLNTEFEEINRVLFGGEERQLEGVIVELSKEQIRELSRHAKPSPSKTNNSFEYEPFYLRGLPIYSNNFGEFYEITPEKNPQLKNFDIFLNTVDINEGGLLLPHYNSKAIVILVVNEGEANIELVGLKEQQQEEETREVRKYRAELSEDDIFVIPAAYPFVINATSNLNFVAFGINAENNQRNFLAGEKDNVISQIQRQVKELAFPGSAQDVENLIKNQRESYFVDAQPQQKEKRNKGRKGPLSSILGALF